MYDMRRWSLAGTATLVTVALRVPRQPKSTTLTLPLQVDEQGVGGKLAVDDLDGLAGHVVALVGRRQGIAGFATT